MAWRQNSGLPCMATEVVGVRESVLANAVRAYTLARKRGAMQKNSYRGHRRISKAEIEGLAREFPEAYLVKGNQLTYIGRSPDDILEEYLENIGKPRRSKLWFDLAVIVVARGERVMLEAKQGE